MVISSDFIREIVGDGGPRRTVLYIGLGLSGIAKTWEDRSQNIQTIAMIQGSDSRRGRINPRDSSTYDENNQLINLSHLTKKRTSNVSTRRSNRRTVSKLTTDLTTPYYHGMGILNGALTSNRVLTAVPVGGFVDVDLDCFAKKYFSRTPHPCAFNRLVRSLAACLNAEISCELSVTRPTVLNCRYEIRPRKQCRGGLQELVERLISDEIQLLTNIDVRALTVTLDGDGRFVIRSGDDYTVTADEVIYNLDPAEMALVRAQMTKRTLENPDLAMYQSTFLVDIGTDAICSVLGPDIRACCQDPDGSIFTVAFAASGGDNSIGDPCMSGTVSIYTRFNPFSIYPRTGLIPNAQNFDCSRQALVHIEMTDTSYRGSLRATRGDDTVGTPIPSLVEYIASIRRAAGIIRCVRQAFGVDTLTLIQIIEEIRATNIDGTFNIETFLNNTPLIAGASYNWIHEINDYFGLELFADNALTRAEVPNVNTIDLGR